MQEPNTQYTESVTLEKGWRYRLGLLLFFGAFPIFFATPIVIPMLGLSTGESAALIGGILLAVEVLWFASIPLLGKQGFNTVKQKAFGWIKFSSAPVTHARHRFGVFLLLGCILLDMLLNLAVVAADLFVETAVDPNTLLLGMTFQQQATVYITSQILTTIGVLVAVFLLGDEFWERIRNAFTWHPGQK